MWSQYAGLHLFKQLAVESRDLSQAEKEINCCQTIHISFPESTQLSKQLFLSQPKDKTCDPTANS